MAHTARRETSDVRNRLIALASRIPGGRANAREATADMSTTRDRIVDASAELFRRQGYAATGVKQIVTEAQAPFGSLYHFFPGGKQGLGAEAIRTSGGL